MKELNFYLTKDSITPLDIVEAGFCGEHLATKIILNLADELIGEYNYLLSIKNAGGEFFITDHLVLTDNKLIYTLPNAVTAISGIANINLVIKNDQSVLFSYPLRLRFLSTAERTSSAISYISEVSDALTKTEEFKEEAKQNAELSKNYLEETKSSIDTYEKEGQKIINAIASYYDSSTNACKSFCQSLKDEAVVEINQSLENANDTLNSLVDTATEQAEIAINSNQELLNKLNNKANLEWSEINGYTYKEVINQDAVYEGLVYQVLDIAEENKTQVFISPPGAYLYFPLGECPSFIKSKKTKVKLTVNGYQITNVLVSKDLEQKADIDYVDKALGDIESGLDLIISTQESLIGGEN